MDVNFDNIIVIHYDHTVANGFQVGPQRQRIILILFADDKLCAIGIGDIPFIIANGVRCFRLGCGRLFLLFLRRDDNAIPEDAHHPLKDDHQSPAAGIHDTGFF